MARPKRGEILSLTIDDLAYGGQGVGRADGYVVFVPGGLPGARLQGPLAQARPGLRAGGVARPGPPRAGPRALRARRDRGGARAPPPAGRGPVPLLRALRRLSPP